MSVTVTMSVEELVEFLDFRKDKKVHVKRIARLEDELKLTNQKIAWAIAPDPKRDGKYKIADHDHADDLWAMANNTN